MANLKPIYEKKSGRLLSYFIRVFRGRDSEGRQLKPFATTFKVEPSWSEKTARRKAEAFAAVFEEQCKEGKVSDNTQTFQQFCEYVINLKEARNVKPTTIASYRFLTKRIYPEIGFIKLKDLRATHLNNFYTKLATEKNRNYSTKAIPKKPFGDVLKQKKITRKTLSENSGVALHTVAETVKGKSTSLKSAQAIADALNVDFKELFAISETTIGLSTKTIAEHHQLIHTVLAQAVKEDILPVNVSDKVEIPRVEKKDANYFSIEQIGIIEEQLKNESILWQTIVYLFMTTGCRRGEILALKWADIDFKQNKIYVHANLLYEPGKGIYIDEPKTKKSNRVISIPLQMTDILMRYKGWQDEEKNRLGSFYDDQNFVFAHDNGKPMRPDSVSRWMKNFGDKCGFRVNAHAFRHTVASVLCFSGVDIVSISKRLGHADVSTTTDIYSHIMDRADEKSADALGDIIFPD